MSLLIIFLGGCLLLGMAYRFYGRTLSARLAVDPARETPAHTRNDGVDYVPTRAAVLFGHHFSSIAGAGPIVGPIIAGLAFGWAPALLWILIGSIFIGGTHDYAALIASIRHDGRSIAQICRERVGRVTYYAMLVFILLTLIYVIIVFLDLTATSFAPVAVRVAEVAQEGAGLKAVEGGAVATASVFYILLAALFGLSLYRFKVPLWAGTLIFVPLVFGGIALGFAFPLSADRVPEIMGSAKNFWALVLLLYCFFASILPVWLLLQPRDYLSSFLLYACLIGGVAGLIATAASGSAADLQYPAFRGWTDSRLGFLFPALFVTIACGAVSGFHAIVASGTSAKQLASETAAKPVGYGGMLVEAVLALLALATVMVLPRAIPGQTPVQLFAKGLGVFISHLGFSAPVSEVFSLLAVSTFLLTTLDTCTRLARFILQEMLGLNGGLVTRTAATLAVLAIPAWMVFQQIPGPDGRLIPAWNLIWPAFGASNQLLAALALLVIFAWLRSEGRRAFYVGIPMAFMCVTTITALAQLAWQHLVRGGNAFVGGISLLLTVLALGVIGRTLHAVFRRGHPGMARRAEITGA